MPTFEVTCAECGGLRWPLLRERPTRYVCEGCQVTKAARAVARKRAKPVSTP